MTTALSISPVGHRPRLGKELRVPLHCRVTPATFSIIVAHAMRSGGISTGLALDHIVSRYFPPAVRPRHKPSGPVITPRPPGSTSRRAKAAR